MRTADLCAAYAAGSWEKAPCLAGQRVRVLPPCQEEAVVALARRSKAPPARRNRKVPMLNRPPPRASRHGASSATARAAAVSDAGSAMAKSGCSGRCGCTGHWSASV